MFRPVPAEADFTALEDEELARWAAHRVFERSVELRAGRRAVGVLRGPAHGQRPPGPPPRVGPGLQGPLLPLPDHAGLRRAPQGRVGHPRAAGRGRGGEAARASPPSARSRRRSASPSSPACARSRSATTWASGRPSPSASATGSTSTTPTGRSTPDYVESVWANLKALWDQALLYEDIKVVPYCPRCGTALSQPRARPARRLPRGGGRVGLRALPADRRGRRRRRACGTPSGATRSRAWPWWPGRPPRGPCCPTPAPPSAPGSTTPWWATPWWPAALVDAGVRRGRRRPTPWCRAPPWSGLRYRRPFDDLGPGPADGGRAGWRVVAGDFVEADEGTGIVHLAPAFGEVDRQVGRDERPARP